jgi:hypothetical protein
MVNRECCEVRKAHTESYMSPTHSQGNTNLRLVAVNVLVVDLFEPKVREVALDGSGAKVRIVNLRQMGKRYECEFIPAQQIPKIMQGFTSLTYLEVGLALPRERSQAVQKRFQVAVRLKGGLGVVSVISHLMWKPTSTLRYERYGALRHEI